MRKIGIFLSIVFVFASTVLAQNNTVVFDNQSGELALVKLIGPTAKEVEVPTGAKRTVTTSSGRYHIKTRYGTPGAYRYTKGEEFVVKDSATTRSRITITLHKVVDGNYDSRPISEADFGEGAEASRPTRAVSSAKGFPLIRSARWIESATHEDFSRPGVRRPETLPAKGSFLLRVEAELYFPEAPDWDLSQVLLQTDQGEQLKPVLYRLGAQLSRLAEEGGAFAVTKGEPQPVLLSYKVTGNKPYQMLAVGGWPGAKVAISLVYDVPGAQRPTHLVHKDVSSAELGVILIGESDAKALSTGDLRMNLWTDDGASHIEFQANGQLSYHRPTSPTVPGVWRQVQDRIEFSIGKAKHMGTLFGQGIAVMTNTKKGDAINWALFPVEKVHMEPKKMPNKSMERATSDSRAGAPVTCASCLSFAIKKMEEGYEDSKFSEI